MALPVVKSATECADYVSTVSPYLYQLRPLPRVVFESITNPAALKQIYLDTNPLITSIAFSFAIAPIFLIVSEINRNYSQVDRFWSILPSVHNVHYFIYAYASGLDAGAGRVLYIALVSFIWSCRLTYNYWRRGGYSIGSEDYRWPFVKDYIGPVGMFILNISFISLGQSLLLCAITFPTYVLLLTTRLASVDSAFPALTIVDYFSAALILGFIAFTTVADQQQWNYQNAKHSYKETARVPAGCGFGVDELERGFRTSGLFAFIRKPNYAAEQAVWVMLYVWSCVITKTWLSWAGVGAVGYLVLFQASTWLTELLTVRKYPEYREYRNQVGKFFPTRFSPPVLERPADQSKLSDGAGSGPSRPRKTDRVPSQARERYNLRQ